MCRAFLILRVGSQEPLILNFFTMANLPSSCSILPSSYSIPLTAQQHSFFRNWSLYFIIGLVHTLYILIKGWYTHCTFWSRTGTHTVHSDQGLVHTLYILIKGWYTHCTFWSRAGTHCTFWSRAGTHTVHSDQGLVHTLYILIKGWYTLYILIKGWHTHCTFWSRAGTHCTFWSRAGTHTVHSDQGLVHTLYILIKVDPFISKVSIIVMFQFTSLYKICMKSEFQVNS